MPPALRSAATAGDVVMAAEGVSVKISGRSIALPGVRAGRSVNLNAGSIVLSRDRIRASVGAWVVLDSSFGEDAQNGHTVTFAADGVHVHLEVPEIYEGGRGTFALHFRIDLDQSVLAALPSTPRAVRVPDGIAPLLRNWA